MKLNGKSKFSFDWIFKLNSLIKMLAHLKQRTCQMKSFIYLSMMEVPLIRFKMKHFLFPKAKIQGFKRMHKSPLYHLSSRGSPERFFPRLMLQPLRSHRSDGWSERSNIYWWNRASIWTVSAHPEISWSIRNVDLCLHFLGILSSIGLC